MKTAQQAKPKQRWKAGLKLHWPRANVNLTGPYEMARHQEVPRPEAVCPFPPRVYRWAGDRRAASRLAIHHTAPPGCSCIGGLGDWRSNRNCDRVAFARRTPGVLGACPGRALRLDHAPKLVRSDPAIS